MSEPESIRTFVAFELPEEVKREAGKLIDELKSTGVKATWSKPENLHLTLKFLGETTLDKVKFVTQALDEVAKKHTPYEASLQGAGGFPNAKRPRVIWVGVDQGAEETVRVAYDLEEVLAPLGFPKEERDFTPHLTLGRIKFPKPNPALAEKFEKSQQRFFGKWKVEGLALVKSTLHPKGPIYEVIHKSSFMKQ